MIIKKGDIYNFALEPCFFPWKRKYQKGIVLSNDVNNKFREEVTIAYVVDKCEIETPERITINSLKEPSVVLCESTYTVPIDKIVGNKIGEASFEEMEMIDMAIIESFGINYDTLIEYVVKYHGYDLMSLIRKNRRKEEG